MQSLGKLLLAVGVALALVGIVVWFAGGRLQWLGKLPGDLRFGDSIYIPITTCVLVSLVLTVLVNLIARLLGR